jgi:hypothetical protein
VVFALEALMSRSEKLPLTSFRDIAFAQTVFNHELRRHGRVAPKALVRGAIMEMRMGLPTPTCHVAMDDPLISASTRTGAVGDQDRIPSASFDRWSDVLEYGAHGYPVRITLPASLQRAKPECPSIYFIQDTTNDGDSAMGLPESPSYANRIASRAQSPVRYAPDMDAWATSRPSPSSYVTFTPDRSPTSWRDFPPTSPVRRFAEALRSPGSIGRAETALLIAELDAIDPTIDFTSYYGVYDDVPGMGAGSSVLLPRPNFATEMEALQDDDGGDGWEDVPSPAARVRDACSVPTRPDPRPDTPDPCASINSWTP